MSDKNPIIEKLKKLLKLAQDKGATEAEAAAAMAKVHELLAQHNLDLSQVEAQVSPDESKVQGKKGRSTNKNNKWEVNCYAGAADLNFCYYYTNNLSEGSSGTTVKIQHVLVGKPVNVLAAELLGDYLRDTVNKMAKKLELEAGEHRLPFLMSGSSEAMYRHKYKQGMSLKLRMRCLELKKARSSGPTKTADGRNLPALQDAYTAAQKQIQEWLDAAKLGLRSRQDKTNYQGYAARAGYQDGDKVGLEQQVQGPQQGGISLEYQK